MNYTELSLEMLRRISIEVAKEIKEEQDVDLLVYVARAGLPIAIYMNEVFNVKYIGIGAQRKGNRLKSKLGPMLAYCPRFIRDILITIEIKSKVHKKDVHRDVKFHESVNEMDVNKYKNILIVEDSVDTGNSMKMVFERVTEKFPKANIITYSLNVWEQSKEIFLVDYSSFENTVIRAPMSKDSKEYKGFCKMYDDKTNQGKI